MSKKCPIEVRRDNSQQGGTSHVSDRRVVYVCVLENTRSLLVDVQLPTPFNANEVLNADWNTQASQASNLLLSCQDIACDGIFWPCKVPFPISLTPSSTRHRVRNDVPIQECGMYCNSVKRMNVFDLLLSKVPMPVNYLRKYWVTFPLDFTLVLAPKLYSRKRHQG